MADTNRSQSDVSDFFSRLKGDDKIRKSDSLIVLNTPQSTRERQVKQKISSIVQYVKNKTWSRRHVEFFEEYRRMTATFPIIKAGIDIYGEEIVAKNSDGKIFTIKCDNKKVKDLLEECYFKNLALNAKGFRIAREMCKFGNTYGYLITRPKDGVTDIVFLPPEAIIREQMYDPSNLENFRFTWYGSGGGALFEPWELVHWKNGEDIEMEPYGSSILRPIVDTWRRVVLIREALVIYRITRAPSKLLFKIGTDGLTGEEAYRFAQDMKKEVQKKPLTNPQTGEIDFKYNPMPISWRTPIPLLDGRTITIKELAKEYEEGKENYVYSIQDDTHQVVAGKVKWCGKNYTANKLVRVWLDNESYIDSAPEHPFMLRDGSKVSAGELKSGDSLMPGYFQEKAMNNVKHPERTYTQIYNPSSGKYEFIHRLVSNEIPKEEYNTRHHKDFNRHNNNPTNLIWMDFEEHKKMHGEIITKYNKSPEGRAKVTRCNKERQSYLAMMPYKQSEKGRKEQSVLVFEMLEKRLLPTSNWKKNMQISFSDKIWGELRKQVIKKEITGHMAATKFINDNLIDEVKSTNVRKSLSKGISGNILRKELIKKGFNSFEEYKIAITKNHKVDRIEILNNVSEDVYCMTVVGLNNEDDRHNFLSGGYKASGEVINANSFISNSIEENIFMPVYEGSPSDVQVLEGAGNLDAVEDYKIIKDDLFAGMKIPKSWLTFEEDLCLSSDTQVVTLDGKEDTLEKLTERFNKGEKLWVYATNKDGNVIPGEVEWVGPTKEVNVLYEVTLDNGEKIKCTDNHPFRLRDGSYLRADKLEIGQSLMPLYRRLTEKRYPKDTYFGYEEVWHNGKQKWEKTHQLVGKGKYKDLYIESARTVLHHNDFNKLNNNPENLIKMDKEEHFNLHAKLANNFKSLETRANKKYGKQKLMQKAYLGKLASGEISQKGESNGNYKGDISKAHLHDILKENIFSSIKKINEFITLNFPEYRSNYTTSELADILEVSPIRLQLMLDNDKQPVEIDLLKFEEIAQESTSQTDFSRRIGKSSVGIINAFKRIDINFSEWFKNIKSKVECYNHKIVDIQTIQLVEGEKVYDLTIKEHHNFALKAGIFVHNSNKSALGEEDVRFAKTIQRLQSEFVEGLLHIGIVHLFLKGCSQEEMESFTIEMNNPSIASEKKKLELVQARIDIAKSAWDYNNPGLNLMSYVDVLKSILKFSDEEIEATIKSQFNEKKIAWRLEQLRTNGTYEEPDLEKRIAQLRGLTGQADGKTPDSFAGLSFEGDSLTEVMKRKIDQEIKEIVGPNITGKPSSKMVRQLTEGSDLMKNLKRSRKDFGM